MLSASKAWNLAGLKAALAVAGPDGRADLDRMPEEVTHGASHFGVMAHTEAFRAGGDWLDALLLGRDANRSLLAEFIADRMPGQRCRPPGGTYLAWIDARALGLHDEASRGPGVVPQLAGPARYLLDRARVALSSGHAFGSGGSGHVRLNFATSRANLVEGLERMESSLRELQ